MTATFTEPVDLDLRRCTYWPEPTPEAIMERFNASREEARIVSQRMMADRVWRSSTHQVSIGEVDGAQPELAAGLSYAPATRLGAGLHLRVRRLDREAIFDRGSLSSIMRVLAPEHVGFEVFPHVSRLLDAANVFHVLAFKSVAAAALVKALARGAPRGGEPGVLTPFEAPTPARGLWASLATGGQGDWRELQMTKDRLANGAEAVMVHHAAGAKGRDVHGLADRLFVLREPAMRLGFALWTAGTCVHAEPQATAPYRQRALPQGYVGLGAESVPNVA